MLLSRRSVLAAPFLAYFNAAVNGAGLLADVETYVRFGEHRTATPADFATSEWLRGRLETAGFKAEFQPWNLDQFFLERCDITIEGRKLDAFPLWIPKSTGPSGLKAPLARYTPDAEVSRFRRRAVLMEPGGAPRRAGRGNVSDVEDSGAVACIMPSGLRSGEIVAQNAVPVRQQRIPKVLVAPAAFQALRAAAQSESEIELRLEGRLERGCGARNVIGRLERGSRWIIISTPHSGWFRCGGERGSGIAVWLALAAWAARSGAKASFLFFSASGHELSYMGAERFLSSPIVPQPADVDVWLHLGANVAARQWEEAPGGWRPTARKERGAVSAHRRFLGAARETFALVPNQEVREGRGIGELRNVEARGYTGIGLAGSNLWIHTRRDDVQSVTPDILEQVARGCVDLLSLVAREAT
jgi:hypothetical protein